MNSLANLPAHFGNGTTKTKVPTPYQLKGIYPTGLTFQKWRTLLKQSTREAQFSKSLNLTSEDPLLIKSCCGLLQDLEEHCIDQLLRSLITNRLLVPEHWQEGSSSMRNSIGSDCTYGVNVLQCIDKKDLFEEKGKAGLLRPKKLPKYIVALNSHQVSNSVIENSWKGFENCVSPKEFAQLQELMHFKGQRMTILNSALPSDEGNYCKICSPGVELASSPKDRATRMVSNSPAPTINRHIQTPLRSCLSKPSTTTTMFTFGRVQASQPQPTVPEPQGSYGACQTLENYLEILDMFQQPKPQQTQPNLPKPLPTYPNEPRQQTSTE